MYINNHLSCTDIANIYNVKPDVIKRRLKKYGIRKDRAQIFKDSEKKMRETMKIKYGVDHPSKSKNIRNKTKETCLKKYGSEYIINSQYARNKSKQTCLKKYGVEYTLQSKDIRKKIIATWIEKYNVDNPMKNLDVQNDLKQSCIKKYGMDNVFKLKEFQEKADNTMLKKYGRKNSSQVKSIKLKQDETCFQRYGVPYFCMTKKCKNANGFTISKINNFYSTKLKENNIENKLEYNLKKFSYDIKLLDRNILIEINPTYTHNSTNSCWFKNHQKQPISKDYHYNKTLCAKENGYRCIHIWDWDDMNKIINMLKEKEKIYARKCEIKEVSKEETKLFLEEYHLQGNCNGQEIRLGLYYNNVLVELMTFGKPRYNKKYEYELLRLCSHKDYVVIGGSKKLFNNFIKKYNPKTIVSYCDNSKFDGEIYNILGFDLLDYGKPSKHWYNMKTKKHITDNLLRQRGFDQLFKANYGKGTSNEELMKENGFVEVYDCGQSTYVYNK